MRFVSILILLFTTLQISAQNRKPNIVILLADDLGYADLSCDGRTQWQTPHIDQMAREGMIFRRWYTAAVICAPSRAALMTGRYSIHNGVTNNSSYDLPRSEMTIATALKQSGYTTALFGKWHQGAARPPEKQPIHPMDRGFDEFFGFRSAVHAWQKFPKELWDGRELKPSQGYADTLFADHAIDFIKRHKTDPFFLYVPFIASHGIVQAPAEEIALHKGKLPEKDPNNPLNATYAAEVTQLDKEVGRILATLDDLNLSNDTLVVFSSDHGATFEPLAQGTSSSLDSNFPFRGQKRTLWEGGVHVPGIVRWPGHVAAGRDSQEIVHMLDLFPTILAATGSSPALPNKLDGVNLLDTILGQSPSPDRTIFWEWNGEGNTQLAAMHNNLKLIITGKNKPELYDVVRDPAERIDVVADNPDEAKRLHAQLDQWLATITDAAKMTKPPGAKKAAGHKVSDE